MSVSSAEENEVRECLMEAAAIVEKARKFIRNGHLPDMDKSELIGDLRGVKNSIVGINSAGLNIYREFRQAA